MSWSKLFNNQIYKMETLEFIHLAANHSVFILVTIINKNKAKGFISRSFVYVMCFVFYVLKERLSDDILYFNSQSRYRYLPAGL